MNEIADKRRQTPHVEKRWRYDLTIYLLTQSYTQGYVYPKIWWESFCIDFLRQEMTQLIFACSKSTTETLEKDVKYTESWKQ